MNLMLINVSTRKLRRLPALAGDGTSKSAASRRFVALSADRLAEWMASDPARAGPTGDPDRRLAHRQRSGAGRRARDRCRRPQTSARPGRRGPPALALDRKKLAAFSALGGGFLQFPIGDRRCKRTRASVSNAGGNARPSLTNATLAASGRIFGPRRWISAVPDWR